MKRTITKISIFCSLFLMVAGAAIAQSADTGEFKPHGKLWGYAFGDLAYKGSGDTVNGGRGGSNQYTKMAANANLFQWRRVYLGYSYEISRKFVAEFLLAAEDDFNSGVIGQGAGDITTNGKFTPYLKLANLRWRNIWKGTDLVIGQAPVTAFAQDAALKEYAVNTQTSEEVWGYRSIERTITDIRRTPSFDMGVALHGTLDSKKNFGYDLQVGNGQSAKVENDAYKWFYADVWGKFFDKKLIVHLYQDYEKLHWGVFVKGLNGPWYNDRNMTKLFVAYTVPKFTVGMEAFQNTLMGDVIVAGKDGNTYYRNTKASAVSLFVKGRITPEKLGFFARFDNYDPTGNLSSIVGDANTKSFTVNTSQYDPTTKETFATFGLDYTPMKNVHIMPNVWINTYESGVSATGTNSAGTVYSKMNSNISGQKGTDAVYRLTFYYIYGK